MGLRCIGFLAYFQYGACIIQPSTMNFPPEELLDMVERGGLNMLHQFGSYLAENFRRSRYDSKLLSAICKFTDIAYGGLELAREADEWAKQNNIHTRVRDEVYFLNSRLMLRITDDVLKH
jgi:hypothetical protein